MVIGTEPTFKANGSKAMEVIRITAPRIRTVEFALEGTSPYVQARFSEKAQNMMAENMIAGSQAKKGKAREPRDFHADYENYMHIAVEGWHGIPASAFRKAIISACRLVNFKMTLAKLSVFIEADGIDKVDGLPLVKLEGTPEPVMHHVRNKTGVTDLRCRPMWREWKVNLRVSYDEDQFSATDVANLLHRVGKQVGVGEGRPDSRESAGLGWGTFSLATSS